MKKNVKGFSIVELLTVMSIIVLLLSLLLPGMNMVRRYAKDLTQRSQFHDITVGLDLFFNDEMNDLEDENYVDSSQNGTDGNPYCGAMKLCEAMRGQDGLGLHEDSKLNEDDVTGYAAELYPAWGGVLPSAYTAEQISNLRARVKYIDEDKINVTSLSQLYSNVGLFTAVDPNEGGGCAVLTDVYKKFRNIDTSEKVGLPILYYRADSGKLNHNIDLPGDPQNIYNYMDNQDLLDLGLPDEPGFIHPLFQDVANPPSAEGELFYEVTRNEKAPSIHQPYNKGTYILIAAGHDGIYGTRDDICNFGK